MNEQGVLLGVDFGLKRVGLSVCDGQRILATPLAVYKTKSMRDTIDYVAGLAKARGAVGIIVGLPLNLDGTESVQSGRVRAFSRNLERVSGLPVRLCDERLTTVEAKELLREAGVKPDKWDGLIDSMSAKVILQSFLEANNINKRSTIMAENQQEQDVELLDDEVITLQDDDGNPVDFNEVACIEYKGDIYVLLQPVEKFEGLEDDEALIFKVTQEDDENDIYEPVEDESVMEAVFDEYLKALAEYESECDCDCDCDCEECGDGCDCDGEKGECDCGCGHHHHD